MALSLGDALFLMALVIFIVFAWVLRYKLTDLNDARSGAPKRTAESRKRLAFYGALLPTIWAVIIFAFALRQMLSNSR